MSRQLRRKQQRAKAKVAQLKRKDGNNSNPYFDKYKPVKYRVCNCGECIEVPEKWRGRTLDQMSHEEQNLYLADTIGIDPDMIIHFINEEEQVIITQNGERHNYKDYETLTGVNPLENMEEL